MCAITYSYVYSLNRKKIFLFKIQNSSGAYIELLNYGATLVSIVVPDRNGFFKNVILNFDNIEDYISNNYYLGSSIGRFANRISNARFALDGVYFDLDKNDGTHCQHGGFFGFNRKVMNYRIKGDNITLFGNSKNGEGGFPGNLHFEITYSFSENNEVFIMYKALSDERTPISLTNHAYFNFDSDNRNILDHELIVYSDEYLEMNDDFLPTGKICQVKDTAFDFREFKKIKNLMPYKQEIFKGYNTYFIYRDKGKEDLKKLASIREHTSGRQMDIYSTMPGVLFYSGDYLNVKHQPFEGLCLEAQFYPDFLNHPNFPKSIIDPGEEYIETIKLIFTTFL